jgi:hypothetical protein
MTHNKLINLFIDSIEENYNILLKMVVMSFIGGLICGGLIGCVITFLIMK